MKVVVNLKSSLAFRVDLHRGDGHTDRFLAKAFRGELNNPKIPEPKEHVAFDVHEIALDSGSVPWLNLDPPQRVSILWSNVLSVQHEEAQIGEADPGSWGEYQHIKDRKP